MSKSVADKLHGLVSSKLFKIDLSSIDEKVHIELYEHLFRELDSIKSMIIRQVINAL